MTEQAPRPEDVVDALVEKVLGTPRSLRHDEVAALSGVPLEEARRLWRAMGFADVGDTVAFTEGDLGALRELETLVARDLLDRDDAVEVTRALGLTTSRLADWQADTFGRLLTENGVLDLDDPLGPTSAAALGRELDVLLPVLERLLVRAPADVLGERDHAVGRQPDRERAELVAAETRGEDAGVHGGGRGELARERGEDEVAGVVPAEVVDGLEAVDVGDDHAHRHAALAVLRERDVEVVLEGTAVGETGEVVRVDEPLDPCHVLGLRDARALSEPSSSPDTAAEPDDLAWIERETVALEVVASR